jgi:hypothetical protein
VEASTRIGPFADELAQMLGEPVEHSQRFFPGGRQLRPEWWYRAFRRWRGRGRVDDALPSLTVAYIALTPTRLAIVNSGFARGRGHYLTQPFAIWRRDELSARAQRVEMTRGHGDTRALDQRLEAIRLVLGTPQGELWADLPEDDPLSTDLVHALGATVGD